MRPTFLLPSLAVCGALVLIAPTALADTLAVTDELHADVSSVALGSVCPGEQATATVAFQLKRAGQANNSNTWANGTSVAIAAAPVADAQGSASSGSTTATTLANWTTAGNGATVDAAPVTITLDVAEESTAGPHSLTLHYVASGTGNTAAVTERPDDLGLTWTTLESDDAACSPPPPVNQAPVVSAQAADANGNEGSTLTTTGAFSDPDGDPLTVTKTAGVGTVTDNGDGSFSWSLPTTDDGAGSVTVQASDGDLSVTQTFAWSAANVAPGVGPVTATYADACTAAVSAPFSDPGSADTHSATIDWGDTATTGVNPATSPVTGSHTYATAGTYAVDVSVIDDDGGTGSASLAGGFTTKNTAGPLMQPINAAGSRSTFKLGSTIPVKIGVTACGGGVVSTLTPTVTITRLDAQPDGSINETPADSVATNGLQMRWDASAGHYVYNLSTKLSQQYGAALTAGTYRITVNDPSFFAPTSAVVDLRK